MSSQVLLDTHILAWAVLEPERLSARARKAILEADVVYVSSVTAWEIAMLAARRRLELMDMGL